MKIINNDTVIGDWKCPGAEVLIKKTESLIKNGSMILLHDGSQCEDNLKTRPKQMLEALPHIIQGVKSKGFIFVGIDKLNLVPEYFSTGF